MAQLTLLPPPVRIHVLLPNAEFAWVSEQPTVATFDGNPVPAGVFEPDRAKQIAAEWDASGCLTELVPA